MKEQVKLSDYTTFTSAFMSIFAMVEVEGLSVDKITVNEECYTKLRIQNYPKFSRAADKKRAFLEDAIVEIDKDGPYAVFTLSDRKEIQLLS